MDREAFLETIKKQYAEDIHEAYIECEHENGEHIDFKNLDTKLTKLKKSAKVEGLPGQEFDDLVQSTLPGVWDRLEMAKQGSGRKAA